MLPPPSDLSRQLTESKWEAAEELLREKPLLKECIVEIETDRYVYKLVRKGMRVVRIQIRLRH